MFIRCKSTPNSPRRSVQIVESLRVDGKVKQKILRHVGIAMNDEELERLKDVAEFIKSQLEAEHQPDLFSAEEAATQVIQAKRAQNSQDDQQPLNVDLKQLSEIQRSIVGIHEVYEEVYRQLGALLH